ncbi:flagellar basal body P-ring formation chaperone FlgA [Ostreiculturibacter nitratireducens]|uniref:flagellar basal body P-ring formation chaperone FlgA n=1 Tax=Ostreiculturibacter nitratireducens TaxID=3075226 RepID=UPI0031B5DA34
MLGREFWALSAVFLLLAGAGRSETVVAERTIRAQAMIMPEDVALSDMNVPGMLGSLDEVLGMEARVAIYAGRPIRPGDVGPPAVIERNQVVPLLYRAGALTISTEGRALGRGGVGDTIRVMNIASRTTLNGLIAADGSVHVLAGS